MSALSRSHFIRSTTDNHDINQFDFTGIEKTSADDESAVAGLLSLASVSQHPYVSELLSFTINRFHKEPEMLRVDAERIRRQMHEVAVGNYSAFISAADALQAIRGEVSSMDKHLESLGI